MRVVIDGYTKWYIYMVGSLVEGDRFNIDFGFQILREKTSVRWISGYTQHIQRNLHREIPFEVVEGIQDYVKHSGQNVHGGESNLRFKIGFARSILWPLEYWLSRQATLIFLWIRFIMLSSSNNIWSYAYIYMYVQVVLLFNVSVLLAGLKIL